MKTFALFLLFVFVALLPEPYNTCSKFAAGAAFGMFLCWAALVLEATEEEEEDDDDGTVSDDDERQQSTVSTDAGQGP